MLLILLMSKGLKEALTVLIVTHVTHVERVESGVCGLYVTAEVSSLTRLTNDAFRVQDTSFRLKCLRLRCHDFSALAD